MFSARTGLVAIAAFAALSVLAARPANAAQCGQLDVVEVADMKWPTATLLAQIHKAILERGFGCNVRLVRGEMDVLANAMAARGSPDILPELWTATLQQVWHQGVENGRVTAGGEVLSDGVVEGWWIPEYVAEKNPDLKSAGDLARYKALFKDPASPEMGRFYNCPPTWECAIINRNLLSAFRLDKSFKAYSPGSGGDLEAAIAKAYANREPIVAYHWAPSALIGKYPMVALDLGKYNAKGHNCNKTAGCRRPYPGRYPVSQVITGVSSKLAARAPALMPYLQRMSFDTETMNRLLAWQRDNRASARATAEYFLKTFPAMWTGWLPRAIAGNISESQN